MKEMSVEAYNEGWDVKWDDMKKYGPMSRHIRRNIKILLYPLKFASVLDVGCGQGSFLVELTTEFPHIQQAGTDISTSAVELAQKRVPSGRFWALDATKDCLDEKFDVVVCSEVLEHIPDDLAALRNIARMTGKYLVISTVQGRMRRFEPEQVGHVRNYAPGELVRKVEQSGLKVLKVVEWGFPFYSPIYRNVLDLTGSKGTTGEFGTIRKLVSQLIYILFRLNSAKRGDEIFVLAEAPQ
jgi:2-polyprenyl-3-methyl-5-hydroxy-6-metoxy-1,4-benzoquinol methylase